MQSTLKNSNPSFEGNTSDSKGRLHREEYRSTPICFGLKQDRLVVFMCHAKEDKPQVSKIYEFLWDAGFYPWLDDKELMPGEVWAEKIEETLHSAGAIIVCVSRESIVKDGFVQKEIRTALTVADEKAPGSSFIFPVKLDNCEIPHDLSRWQWAEAGDNSTLDRLVAALNERARILRDRSAQSIGPSDKRLVERPIAKLDLAVNAATSPLVIAVMGTKGGVGKGVFVSFAAQLLAVAGGDVAVIDLDLAASGTTLAAEDEYGHNKPLSIVTAFDHVARQATNILRYSAGKSDELWDITPIFLERICGGHIWLLPARELANPGQSFDVVANVLPPEKREEKLAMVVQEQLDRIFRSYPKVRAILVDCGAERNPIYGAAFSKAHAGYILFGPNPEYFGEVKAVRDELLRMYPSIISSRIYAVANNVASVPDRERCKVGISPTSLLESIPSDPTLQSAKSAGLPTHIDLGHTGISESVSIALARAVGDRKSLLLDAKLVRYLPALSLFLGGGGIPELIRKFKARARLFGVGIALGASLTASIAVLGMTLTATHRTWIGAAVALLLGGSFLIAWKWRETTRYIRLLVEFSEVNSAHDQSVFQRIVESMEETRSKYPALFKAIERWIERSQQDERKKR